MIKFLIVLCAFYIGLLISLPSVCKYIQNYRLETEYNKLVGAKDCSVCYRHNNKNYEATCAACRSAIISHNVYFEEVLFDLYKTMKNKEVNENG